MIELDRSVALTLNQWVGQWPTMDAVLLHIAGNHLLKGGAMLIAFWALWFAPGRNASERRARLVGMLAGCLLAMTAARLLAITLPARLRPIHDPTLGLTPAIGLDLTTLTGWSSFPSDHGALYAALAVGYWIVCPRIGRWAALYAMVVILAPRAVLGLHYVGDLVVGAGIGALSVWMTTRPSLTKATEPWVEAGVQRFSPALYAGLFLLTSQMAENFDSTRALLVSALRLGQRLGGVASMLAG